MNRFEFNQVEINAPPLLEEGSARLVFHASGDVRVDTANRARMTFLASNTDVFVAGKALVSFSATDNSNLVEGRARMAFKASGDARIDTANRAGMRFTARNEVVSFAGKAQIVFHARERWRSSGRGSETITETWPESGTWYKPNYPFNTQVTLHLVGGGAGGNGHGGGGGGGGIYVNVCLSSLPASVDFTVGKGGLSGMPGGDTVFSDYIAYGGLTGDIRQKVAHAGRGGGASEPSRTHNGAAGGARNLARPGREVIVHRAAGGFCGGGGGGYATPYDITLHTAGFEASDGGGSFAGGGGGAAGTWMDTDMPTTLTYGGDSVWAGRGGNSAATHDASLAGENGQFPGGGGAKGPCGSHGAGANGWVRLIYHNVPAD